MTAAEAFPGLAKRCRWRSAEIANGRCRFDPDVPTAPCSLLDCPAMALGITAACVIPEIPRRKDVVQVAGKKKGKKGPQSSQDPAEMALNFVAGLIGFVPEEEPENER